MSLSRTQDPLAGVLSGELPLHAVFQPIMALATGRVVAYEALARFPAAGPGSTEGWFTHAHRAGHGAELEAAALRAALEPIGRPVGTLLSVNLSPSVLASQSVVAGLPDDLSDLIVEVTERESADDERVVARLSELRDRGALIAIDDAGAGYAGLTQVMRLRPDVVKLDRALIQDIHADPARLALVESFVRFARRTDAVVCAEGIETLQELEALANLDVQWGQGYALARPAEPWAPVAPGAVDLCRASLQQALRAGQAWRARVSPGDSGLEHASAELANVRSRAELQAALRSIAAVLDADEITLSLLHAELDVLETLAAHAQTRGASRFALRDYPLTAHVMRYQEAVQVLVGDPRSDPDEVELLLSLGQRSLLMVPVINRGESVGLLEATRVEEDPWTRLDINRARIVSSQFASLVEMFRAQGRVPY